MRQLILTIGLAVCASLSACSSQTAYLSTQNWRRIQCEKLVSSQDREQCLKKASLSHEAYEKEREAAKK